MRRSFFLALITVLAIGSTGLSLASKNQSTCSLPGLSTLAHPDLAFIDEETTWNQLQEKFGHHYTLSFQPQATVDFAGVFVQQNGCTLFTLLTDRSSPLTGNTTFSTLLIEQPGITTSEGIGPGSLIAQAEKVYGPVTLQYNPENESREFAIFAQGPDSVAFRTGTGEQAGIYAKGSTSTQLYHPEASIQSIWIRLPPHHE